VTSIEKSCVEAVFHRIISLVSSVLFSTVCSSQNLYLTHDAEQTTGNQQREDVIAMLQKYPAMNEYWQDKRADISSIQCPAYVLASMSTGLHTVGSLRGFEDIRHDKKWLRLHSTQEWHDLYQKHSIADFKKFLDFYMKGQDNGWDQTPRARISVISYNKVGSSSTSKPHRSRSDVYQANVDNLPFTAWPVPEAKDISLRLSADGTLQSSSELVKGGQSFYASDAKAENFDADSEELSFTYTFSKQTRLIGSSKAVLYMSCPDHDDLDVFVILRKIDKDGRVLRNCNIPFAELKAVGGDGIDNIVDPYDLPTLNSLQYVGPSGILRASHREIDASISKHNFPHHKHTSEEKFFPGQVVKLEIGMWAAGIQFEAGEKLVLRVSGHDMRLPEFEALRGSFTTANKGRHVIHVGGEHDSHLVLPLLEY
jgi:predicted acyl esterase